MPVLRSEGLQSPTITGFALHLNQLDASAHQKSDMKSKPAPQRCITTDGSHGQQLCSHTAVVWTKSILSRFSNLHPVVNPVTLIFSPTDHEDLVTACHE